MCLPSLSKVMLPVVVLGALAENGAAAARAQRSGIRYERKENVLAILFASVG